MRSSFPGSAMFLRLTFLALACFAGAATPAQSADMDKTLHVAFGPPKPIRSASGQRHLFVRRHQRDLRFAVRLRLFRAAGAHRAQHRRHAAGDHRRRATYTIKSNPGSISPRTRLCKGKRRELTADDYVYSIKRVFDPKVRSYWLYFFEGKLVGLDERCLRAQERHPRLRRQDRGTAGDRPVHAADPVQAAELRVRVVARESAAGCRGARSRGSVQGWLQSRDGKSGGHRALPPERVDARTAHPARSQPGLPRSPVSGAAPAARRPMRRSPRASSVASFP